jgi:hypothetical protein
MKKQWNCEVRNDTKCMYLQKAATSATLLVINNLTRNTIRNKMLCIRYIIDSQ